VVGALVLVPQAVERLASAREDGRRSAVELVRQRQYQADRRVLVVRIDLEYVAVNALRFPGLIEQPIALGFREGARDTLV